jgi:hypothetical protein
MEAPHRWDKPIDSLPTGLIGMSAQRCRPDRTSKTFVLQCNQRVRSEATPDQPRHGNRLRRPIRPLARFHRVGAHSRQGRLGSRDVPTGGHLRQRDTTALPTPHGPALKSTNPCCNVVRRWGACSRASPGCARRVLSCRTSHADRPLEGCRGQPEAGRAVGEAEEVDPFSIQAPRPTYRFTAPALPASRACTTRSRKTSCRARKLARQSPLGSTESWSSTCGPAQPTKPAPAHGR